MDFSLTHLIVVPSDNILPTTGSTQNLTPGQTGVFRPDYSVATAGNAAAAKYLYVAQGKADTSSPSLRSDKIDKNKTIEWYKVEGSATYSNQISEVGTFVAKCDEDLRLTLRLHSSSINVGFYNGLTKSFVIKTPCCECGEDPCTEVDNEAVVDLFLAKINQDFNAVSRESVNLLQFLEFQKLGTGADAVIRITSKDIARPTPLTSDIHTNTFFQDRLWFRAFVTAGPTTTSDFEIDDRCEKAGAVTVIQRATYPRLTAPEVRQLEKDYYSYKVSRFKELYRNSGYNPLFESYVEDGVVYDQYLIQFKEYDQNNAYTDVSEMDSRVLLFIPNTITNLQAVIAAHLGTVEDESGPVVTTTSTTSTTTTSTTSTTTLIP